MSGESVDEDGINGDQIRSILVYWVNQFGHSLADALQGGHIELAVSHEFGDKVVIRVQDSGMGVAEEQLPSLFERNSPLRNAPRKRAEPAYHQAHP